jgi:hypothetical protein
MAHLAESVAVIKISKLLRDGEVAKVIFDEELVTNLTSILEELIDDKLALVEVITGDFNADG